MRRRFVIRMMCLVLACRGAPAFAHVLGGYYAMDNAIGVAIGPNEIAIEMVVLPAEVPTASLMATADTNHDGSLDEEEARELVTRYEGSLREYLEITLNGERVALGFQWGSALLLTDVLPGPQLEMIFHFKVTGARPKPGRNEMHVHDKCHVGMVGIRNVEFYTREPKGISIAKVTRIDSCDPTLYPDFIGELPSDYREATAVFEVVAGAEAASGTAPVTGPREPTMPAVRGSGRTRESSKLARLVGDLAKNRNPGVLLGALGLAFVFGILHAAQPGHGKTLVAAYLVGSHGKVRHAVLLGLIVTLTHTFSVYVIGLFVLLGFKSAAEIALIFWLKLVSGIGIAAIGAWMLVRALRKKSLSHVHLGGHHHHHHHHADGDSHEHEHEHEHDHPEEHGIEPPSLGRLLALGITGGLVPCPDGIVVILLAAYLGVIAFGLLLLVSFSLGLATTLVVIGILVVRGSKLIARRLRKPGRVFQWASIISATVICVIGLGMIYVAARFLIRLG